MFASVSPVLFRTSSAQEPQIKLDRKFRQDTVWNYLSFGVQAAVGLALNALILFARGADSLGVFNQIYAIFVIAGQTSVLGLHDSAQKHVAEFADAATSWQRIAVASLFVAVLSGLVGALLLVLLNPVIGGLFKSEEVKRGVLMLAPGLFLFTLNKVLMGILNGQRRMVAFAVGQAVRALTILLVCWFIITWERPSHEFGLAFTIAEAFLITVLLFWVRPITFHLPSLPDLRPWMSRHVRFGSKALIHGFLSEAFIRIDILILGIFLSDREVGVYSFAAFFVEGAYQVAIVVRTMANPILVRLLLAPGMTGLVAFARRTALLSFSATFLACAGIATVYPYLSSYMPQGVIEASYPILLILLLGLLIYSTCVPFDYLFLQSGRPGMQSIYMAVNASVNAILNFVFIPRWGLYGASIATAIAFAWSGTFLNILASSVLGLRGGVFFKHS